MADPDNGGEPGDRLLDDETAQRIYAEILAAVREGIKRRDPILMVLVDPELFIEFHAWWDSWDFKVQRENDVLDAKAFITIAESDHPLGDAVYELVSRSDNERNFLFHRYRDFMDHMKRSPVQVTTEDLRQLFVREKFEEF
ncbi:MAG: hypothetical protein ACE5O2_00200, partial [Armatimonadota bacterium]